MAWVVNFCMTLFRSSHRRCSIRKGVPGNFAKFTGKHVPGHVSRVFFWRMKPATLLKKETLAQVFSCEFCKISKNTFFTKHLWANASDYLKNKQKLSGSEAELFARCTLPVTFCSLLVTFCLLLVTFSQLLWATARLLGTRVTLIYLVDEFFVFSSLVLLKEMRTRSESKILSCCFYVSCKSIELGGRGSPRFPWVTPVVESSWDRLRAM